MVDAFEMAEGTEALDRLIDQAPPKVARNGRPGDPKAAWKQTNIRMAPEVKRRLKAVATAWGVPIEEVVYLALLRYLDGLDSGEIEEPESRQTATRNTVL